MKKITAALAILLFLPFLSFAQEYAVISNKKMKELSIGEIKAIFLKKLTLIDEIKAVPLNLEARDSLRAEFEKEMLNMSFERLKSYWTKQHYLGHRPPISMKSEESVKAFVVKIDGAIGYIKMSSVDESVKVLYTWSD